MKFTADMSWNEIMQAPYMAEYISWMMPPVMYEAVPESLRDRPLIKLEGTLKYPWGASFLPEAMPDSANRIMEIAETDRWKFTGLWQELAPGLFMPHMDGTKSSVGLFSLKLDTDEKRPAVLIVPGGGYETEVMGEEGFVTAEEMAARGYCPFVLSYRFSPNRYPAPQLDLTLAIWYLRTHQEELGILDENLLLIGYSAGGHLCASQTLYSEEYTRLLAKELAGENLQLFEKPGDLSLKASSLCLCYPVVSFVQGCHEDSFRGLTGGDESLRDRLSVERHVTIEYPRTFIWMCEDDDLVSPENGKNLYAALKAAGVETKMIAYPSGGHGCGCGKGTSAEGWLDELIKFLRG